MTWLRTRRRAPPRRQRRWVCRARTARAVARPMHRRHRGQRGGWWLLSPFRPSTPVMAVLRFQPDGLPVATTAEAPLRAGQVVLAVGNHAPRNSFRVPLTGSSKAETIGAEKRNASARSLRRYRHGHYSGGVVLTR